MHSFTSNSKRFIISWISSINRPKLVECACTTKNEQTTRDWAHFLNSIAPILLLKVITHYSNLEHPSNLKHIVVIPGRADSVGCADYGKRSSKTTKRMNAYRMTRRAAKRWQAVLEYAIFLGSEEERKFAVRPKTFSTTVTQAQAGCFIGLGFEKLLWHVLEDFTWSAKATWSEL